MGEWKGVQDGNEVKLTYTLTSDGSALIEEFRPSKGAVMIAIFTLDGDHLIATHSRGAGNQANMATGPIADAQTKRLAFSLIRVTGLNAEHAPIAG